MMEVMPDIIHSDQKGFMKSRRMACNIRKIFDLMIYCEEQNIDSIILSLDFMKCFDKIEFTAIEGSFRYFKFSEYIIDWIKMLYKDFTAVVQNSGFFSEKIKIQKGVHQGGCASSLIFLLCAEVLAIEIRKCDEIQGIPVNELTEKLGQFADDMDIYQLFKQESLQNTMKILHSFQKESGFTVNYDKTQIYRIGSLCNSDAKLFTFPNVKWTNDKIKVLGVNICDNEDRMIKENYTETIEKMKNIFKCWYNRNLSLAGKITVINTMIGSLFVHKMTVLPNIPDNIISVFNEEVEKYIWNNHKPKIKLKTLQADYSVGGMNLVDLRKKDMSLKYTWIDILQGDPQLSNVVYTNISKGMGELIWKCNLNIEDVTHLISRKKNPFWYDVLCAWSAFRDGCNIQYLILWNNSEIRIENRPIYWKKCYEQGLIYVWQLYESGKMISALSMCRKYGMTLMEANGLITAIPKWIREIAKEQEQNIENLKTVESKSVYRQLMSIPLELSKIKDSWEYELTQTISVESLLTNLKNIMTTTNLKKYRSFQYRLIHRGIVTNAHLYRWRILEDNLCTFCRKEKETYIHLFVFCECVQPIWIQIEEYMTCFSEIRINFGPEAVIMNKLIENPIYHVKNFICLVVKQYIYRQRCLKKKLSFNEITTIISNMYNMEKYIAIKNRKIRKFNNKWNPEKNATP